MLAAIDTKKVTDGANKLVALRPQMEAVADQVCKKGFDNVLFTSAGGSLAALSPFCEMMKHMSRIPAFTEIPAEMMVTGNPMITDKTLAILTSKSGDTKETVAAAEWLKNKGAIIVSMCGEENSPLAKLSDFSVNYADAEPHDLLGIYLVGKILKNAGDFDDYEVFADQLNNLGEILVTTAKESEGVAEKYASYFDPVDKEYQIWTGSGNTWGHTYSMAMCVLEECQWLRTKSVHSAEFFHGTLEMVERNVLVCVGMGEGPTRPLDERVIRFAEKHTNQVMVFDTKTLSIPGVDEKFRWLLSPVLLWEMYARTYRHLADVRKHDMDIRRYYRRLNY
jgi:fructoselysine-6-phosphate deglycase